MANATIRSYSTVEIQASSVSDLRKFLELYDERRGHKVTDDRLETPVTIKVTYPV